MNKKFDETVAVSRADLASRRRREPLTLVLSHSEGTTVVDMRTTDDLVIGRMAPADLLIPDDTLSRRHTRIRVDGTDVLLEDLSSKNGTFVNGERITGSQRVRTTDQILLGGVTALLSRRPAATIDARGFLPHDTFTFLVQEEVMRARAFSRPFALVLVRVTDGGHVARLASDLGRVVRPVDRLAVFSDDTLEIFMPEATPKDATTTAEKILELALALGIPTRGIVAPYPAAATTVDALFARASEALAQVTSAEPLVVIGPQTAESAPAKSGGVLLAGAKINELFAGMKRVAEANASVLVRGETGTGKEVVARALHEQGPRRRGPMVSVNCGAIQDTLLLSTLFGHVKGAFTGADKDRAGVFEAGKGGTVFLDEIGELPLQEQAKLLRILETKKVTRLGTTTEIDVDFRVVAATHRDLEAMVADGRFREDLFFRLNVLSVDIPPLRERKDEIAVLARHFVEKAAQESRRAMLPIASDAMAALLSYTWPGNVRELRNTLERAVVIAKGHEITLADLPDRVRRLVIAEPVTGDAPVSTRAAPTTSRSLAPVVVEAAVGDFREVVRDYERRVLMEALARADGVQTKAALLLGLPLRTFVHKMKGLGIKRARAGYVVDGAR
jgi:two-component system response regulator AtoC